MLRAQTKTTTSSIARNNVDSSNYKIVRNRLFQRNPIAAMDAISLEEFKQIHKLNDRDKRPSKPRRRPVLPANPTAMQQKTFQVKFDVYKYNETLYKENEALRAAFKEDILESLPESFVDGITDPDTGTMHLTDEEVLNLADKEFGTISPAALELLKSMLPTTSVRTVDEIKELANTYKNYYAVAKSAGSETAECDKVATFLGLMHESFAAYKIFFNKVYKNIPDRKFETAVADMIEAAKELSLSSNIASANSAVATKPTTVITSYNQHMANAAAEARAAGFTKPKSTSTQQYCWTHGPNKTHASKNCRWPHKNHDKSATMTDQKGGKQTDWKRGDEVGP